MIQGDHKDEDKLRKLLLAGFLNFHNVSNVQHSLGNALKSLQREGALWKSSGSSPYPSKKEMNQTFNKGKYYD